MTTMPRVHVDPASIQHVLPDHGSVAFADNRLEWRRLLAELVGTFFLVLVAAGGGVVNAVSHGQVGRAAAVTAPGIMVLALIYTIGETSGAHLNPAVTVAFAARGHFPWGRVPGYLLAQLCGAVLAAGLLRALFGSAERSGGTFPGPGIATGSALVMEIVLTLGLVTVILGTASGARNVGHNAAIAVGGYVALAGLWASPVSGASMNPARSLGPALVSGDLRVVWIYLAGPVAGGLIAVALAWALRGPGSSAADVAAQGAADAPRPAAAPNNPTAGQTWTPATPQPIHGRSAAKRPHRVLLPHRTGPNALLADLCAALPGVDDPGGSDGRGDGRAGIAAAIRALPGRYRTTVYLADVRPGLPADRRPDRHLDGDRQIDPAPRPAPAPLPARHYTATGRRVSSCYAARGLGDRRRRSRVRSALLSPPQIPSFIELLSA
jgi:aquaporin Z